MPKITSKKVIPLVMAIVYTAATLFRYKIPVLVLNGGAKTLLHRLGIFAVVLLFLQSTTQSSVYALTAEQRKLFGNGIMSYEPGSAGPTCSASHSTASSGGIPPSNSTNEVIAFAHQPITATYNIADKTVEQWYLKQGSAQGRVAEFGLTPGNIGIITAAVKSAGVSPVFFYTYAVTEGSGLGGFINHYTYSAPGGGVENAKKDAAYIAAQAQKTGDNPAWIDLDNYVDFVPKEIQASGNEDFKNMPLGTIGRIIIPATAAAAWSVYYPDGLKKEFNKIQNYGAPIQGIMNSIKKLGGNPMEGGSSATLVGAPGDSTGTCTSTVTGEGMTKAINWAVMIANNDGYGYDQTTRESGWEKWQTDPNCTTNCGSLDCSSFISAMLTVGGYYEKNPHFNTSNEVASLESIGFTKVASSATTIVGLQKGDILHVLGHTAMYIGDGQVVHASINENGDIVGGKVGDQTGKEIFVRPFYDHPWTGVWRETTKPNETKSNDAKDV